MIKLHVIWADPFISGGPQKNTTEDRMGPTRSTSGIIWSCFIPNKYGSRDMGFMMYNPEEFRVYGLKKKKYGIIWVIFQIYPNIRRPRPSPRQGRRLGPPQVWNLSFLATGIPRPHPWLFMGVQACRLPALKRSKPLKPLKGHFHGFLWASSAGKSYPKARSIAVSRRSSVPFARHSQPTGIRRPLQWLLLGFQRRLPGLKPSKPLKPLTGHFNGFLCASSAGKSPHPWLFMAHIHGFLWASKLAICQA